MKRCRQCHVPLEGPLARFLKATLRVRPSPEDPALCNYCVDKKKSGTSTYICQICNRPIDEAAALTHVKAEEYLLGLIKKDHPEWKEDKETCPKCVDYYRELIKKANI